MRMPKVPEVRTPLVEEAALRMIEMIQEQNMKAGDQLPNEFDLARLLNVGRGTVREAVKLLISRNILEIKRGKGTFVCEKPGIPKDPLGLEFYRDKKKVTHDLLELRKIIEPTIAGMAAERASQEQILQLNEIVRRMTKKAEQSEDCSAEDVELHVCIAECTQNLVVPSLLPIITTGIADISRLSYEKHWDRLASDHQKIVDAISNRNVKSAKDRMLWHLDYIDIILKTQTE